MDYDLLTDEERKEREGIWTVTRPHCGVGHGVQVDDSDLGAIIAEQAATIERFREWYRAETDCRDSGDIIVNFWDAPTTKRLDRRREAYAAITTDMGEEENADDVFFDIQEDERRRFEAGLP